MIRVGVRIDQKERQGCDLFGEFSRVRTVHAAIDQRGFLFAAEQIKTDVPVLDAPGVLIDPVNVFHVFPLYCCQPVLYLFPRLKDQHPLLRTVPDQLIHGRPVIPPVIPHEFLQFRIRPVLGPRNIRSDPADPFRDPAQALIFAETQKNDGVAGAEARLIRPAVVAVDDPLLPLQDLFQPPVEFVPRDMSPVRPPPDVVQMDQRQAGPFPHPSGQRALPAAGAAQYDDLAADRRHVRSFSRRHASSPLLHCPAGRAVRPHQPFSSSSSSSRNDCRKACLFAASLFAGSVFSMSFRSSSLS